MNERLTEIYRSCRPAEALKSQDIYESANVLLGSEVEKFAELLLNEFIDALEYSNCRRGEASDYGLSILIDDIKERFGVKE